MQRFKNLSKMVVSINAFSKKSFLEENDMEDVMETEREEMINEILKNPSRPSFKHIYMLSSRLMSEGISCVAGGTQHLFYAVLLREWILLYENRLGEVNTSSSAAAAAAAVADSNAHDAGSYLSEESKPESYTSSGGTKGRQASPKTFCNLARGHFELWSRRGVMGDPYHLIRAKELFQLGFASVSEAHEAHNLMMFCKVLQFLGHMEQAGEVIQTVLTNFESDPQYPNYLFYAGGLYKAMGDYDKASTYFFEASQIGPPKFFTKLEMMIIISRTIEEQQAASEEEGEEEAYRMVHAHLILDGVIEDDVEYDDWISDADTWMKLGDKCAMHQMFALATDLYGLAMMKDMDAFRKPMLWFRFAKSCHRCGRTSDAQLAVKQALTETPHNSQLLFTQKRWEDSQSPFKELLNQPLEEILKGIPPEMDIEERTFHRMQAVAKGIVQRYQMRLGVGRRKDVNQRMTARVAVMLTDNVRGVTHPVLLRVSPSWMGKITHVDIYDVKNDVHGKIPLKTPFTPMKESGMPRKLKLSMSARHVVLRTPVGTSGSRNTIANGVPFSTDETGSKVETEDAGKEDEFVTEEITELIFKFTDVFSSNYTYRRMKLNLHLDAKSTASYLDINELRGSQLKATVDSEREEDYFLLWTRGGRAASQSQDLTSVSTRQRRPSMHTIPESAVVEDGGAAAGAATNNNIVGEGDGEGEGEVDGISSATAMPPTAHRLTLDEKMGGSDKEAVTVHTNIVASELSRSAFEWKGLHYLVRVINEQDVTQITLFQVRSGKMIVFLLGREYICRAQKLFLKWPMLFTLIEDNPLLKPMFNGERIVMTDEEFRAVPNPAIVNGLNCFVNFLPGGQGATTILVDPNNKPIIGSGFEVVENEAPEDIREMDRVATAVTIPAAQVDTEASGSRTGLKTPSKTVRSPVTTPKEQQLNEEDGFIQVPAKVSHHHRRLASAGSPSLSPSPSRGRTAASSFSFDEGDDSDKDDRSDAGRDSDLAARSETPPAVLIRLSSMKNRRDSQSFRSSAVNMFLSGRFDVESSRSNSYRATNPSTARTDGSTGGGGAKESHIGPDSASARERAKDKGEDEDELLGGGAASPTLVPSFMPAPLKSFDSFVLPVSSSMREDLTASPPASSPSATPAASVLEASHRSPAPMVPNIVPEALVEEEKTQSEPGSESVLDRVEVEVKQEDVKAVPTASVVSAARQSLTVGQSLSSALNAATSAATAAAATEGSMAGRQERGHRTTLAEMGMHSPTPPAPSTTGTGPGPRTRAVSERLYLSGVSSSMSASYDEELEQTSTAMDAVFDGFVQDDQCALGREWITDMGSGVVTAAVTEQTINALTDGVVGHFAGLYREYILPMFDLATEKLLQTALKNATVRTVEIRRKVDIEQCAAAGVYHAIEQCFNFIDERERLRLQTIEEAERAAEKARIRAAAKAKAIEEGRQREERQAYREEEEEEEVQVEYEVIKINSKRRGQRQAKRDSLVPVLDTKPKRLQRMPSTCLTLNSMAEFNTGPSTARDMSDEDEFSLASLGSPNSSLGSASKAQQIQQEQRRRKQAEMEGWNMGENTVLQGAYTTRSAAVISNELTAEQLLYGDPVPDPASPLRVAAGSGGGSVDQGASRITSRSHSPIPGPLPPRPITEEGLRKAVSKKIAHANAGTGMVNRSGSGSAPGRASPLQGRAVAAAAAAPPSGKTLRPFSHTGSDQERAGHKEAVEGMEDNSSQFSAERYLMPVHPFKSAEELKAALFEWDLTTESNLPGEMGLPLHAVSTISPAMMMPYKHYNLTATGGGKLVNKADDDGSWSISSAGSIGGLGSSTGASMFQTIQQREHPLLVQQQHQHYMDDGATMQSSTSSLTDVHSTSQSKYTYKKYEYVYDPHAPPANKKKGKKKKSGKNKKKRNSGGEEDAAASLDGATSLRSGSAACSLGSLQTKDSSSSMMTSYNNAPLNPIVIIHEERDRSQEHANADSLFDIRKMGYIQRRPLPYATHWRTKLIDFLRSVGTAETLHKRISTLQCTSPMKLTQEEAVCALADTFGSVGEAVAKMQNVEFYSELKLVCRTLHVRSMVCMLDGGQKIFARSDADLSTPEVRSTTVALAKTMPSTLEHGGISPPPYILASSNARSRSTMLQQEHAMLSSTTGNTTTTTAGGEGGNTVSFHEELVAQQLEDELGHPGGCGASRHRGAAYEYLTDSKPQLPHMPVPTTTAAGHSPRGLRGGGHGTIHSAAATSERGGSKRGGPNGGEGGSRTVHSPLSKPGTAGSAFNPNLTQRSSVTVSDPSAERDSDADMDEGLGLSGTWHSSGGRAGSRGNGGGGAAAGGNGSNDMHPPSSLSSDSNDPDMFFWRDDSSAVQQAPRLLPPGMVSLLNVPLEKSTSDLSMKSHIVQSKASVIQFVRQTRKIQNVNQFVQHSKAAVQKTKAQKAKGGFWNVDLDTVVVVDDGKKKADDSTTKIMPRSTAELMDKGDMITDSSAVALRMFKGWSHTAINNVRLDPENHTSEAAVELAATQSQGQGQGPGGSEGEGGTVAVATIGEEDDEAEIPEDISSIGFPLSRKFGVAGAGSGAKSTKSRKGGGRGGGGSSSISKLYDSGTSARSSSSKRPEGRIDELISEYGDGAVAVMCRRDFLKAQQEQTLLKSNKQYIRAPIERKALTGSMGKSGSAKLMKMG